MFEHWEINSIIYGSIYCIFYFVAVYQEMHSNCDSIKINVNNKRIFIDFNLCFTKVGFFQVENVK